MKRSAPSPLGNVEVDDLRSLIDRDPARATLAGVPVGAEAGVLAELANFGTDVVFVARDDVAMERAHAAMKFMAPEVRCLTLPAWDCLPYDRVSPRPGIKKIKPTCPLSKILWKPSARRFPGRSGMTMV